MEKEKVRNIMFHYLFEVVTCPGWYIISYLTYKNDHTETVRLYATNPAMLKEKWRAFAAGHGVGKDNLTWINNANDGGIL